MQDKLSEINISQFLHKHTVLLSWGLKWHRMPEMTGLSEISYYGDTRGTGNLRYRDLPSSIGVTVR